MRGARDEVGGDGQAGHAGPESQGKGLGSNRELLEALSRAVVLSDLWF